MLDLRTLASPVATVTLWTSLVLYRGTPNHIISGVPSIYVILTIFMRCMFTFLFAGFSQCFTDKTCTGDTVPAATERECCVDTNEGLAFADGGACTVCIGNPVFLYVIPLCINMHCAQTATRVYIYKIQHNVLTCE